MEPIFASGSISRVGASVFITLAELSSEGTNVLTADVENFMEIMIDGSVRVRTIFLLDDELTILKQFIPSYAIGKKNMMINLPIN